MKKIVKSLLLTLIIVVLTPALSAIAGYGSSILVSNTGSISHGMLSVNVTTDVDYWESDGFIGVNGTDTRVYRGTVEIPHMMVTDRITMALPLPAYSSQTLQFVTGETPQDFYIVPGYSSNSSVGYVSIADNTTIEMADNFTWTANNIYLNTSNGTDKNIIRKDDAFYLFTSNTTSGNVTAYIPSAIGLSNTLSVTGNGAINQNTLSGAATAWQCVLAADASYIYNSAAPNKLDLFTAQDGNQSGVIDSVVVTVVITQTNGWTLLRTHATNYAGTAGTGTRSTTYTTNPNTGSAWTWQEVADMEIGVGLSWTGGGNPTCNYLYATVNYHYPEASVSITGITSGEYDVTVSANTTHLKLDISGTSNSTALNGASVPDNANDIYLFENNSVAYCGDIELKINGVQQLYYNPNDIIVSAGDTGTLPDRSAGVANDGTIYFGGNPANIALTLGAFESDYTVSTTITDTTTEIVSRVNIGTTTQADAVRIANLSAKDPILYPLFNAINTVTSIPIMIMYQAVFLLLAIGLVFLFGKFGHLTMMVISVWVVMGFATAWGVFDLVLIIILVIVGIGLILMQGRQAA